jgi:adenylate cyclase class 2
MDKNQIETELKFETNEPEKVLSVLISLGAKTISRNKQKTIRFDTSNHDLEQKGVFIRVRSEGDENTITLKEKIGNDETVRQRKETEFKIEDLDKMSYIIEKLGFDYVLIMEKYRIELTYKDSHICIDEMPFGFYVEIEGEETDINNIAHELGFKPEEKIIVTYWDLFEDWKKDKDIQGQNIVFGEGYCSKLINI